MWAMLLLAVPPTTELRRHSQHTSALLLLLPLPHRPLSRLRHPSLPARAMRPQPGPRWHARCQGHQRAPQLPATPPAGPHPARRASPWAERALAEDHGLMPLLPLLLLLLLLDLHCRSCSLQQQEHVQRQGVQYRPPPHCLCLCREAGEGEVEGGGEGEGQRAAQSQPVRPNEPVGEDTMRATSWEARTQASATRPASTLHSHPLGATAACHIQDSSQQACRQQQQPQRKDQSPIR